MYVYHMHGSFELIYLALYSNLQWLSCILLDDLKFRTGISRRGSSLFAQLFLYRVQVDIPRSLVPRKLQGDDSCPCRHSPLIKDQKTD